LKFAGRTPSRILPAARQTQWRSSQQRETLRLWAWAIAAICFVLMIGAATARSMLGDTVSGAAQLQIWNGDGLPGLTPDALRLAPVAASWWQTFGAPALWGGEVAQAMTPRGLLWIIVLALLFALIWNAVARAVKWRLLVVPFVVLLGLQWTGAMYFASSFNVPTRKLETSTQQVATIASASFAAFDFHCHTTLSSGLMTPQQQINWHRVRGFRGMAFTDSNRMMSDAQLSRLREANPDMILLNGCEYQNRKAHLIFLGLSQVVNKRNAPDAREAIRQAKAQGALTIVAHPWDAKHSPEEFVQMGVDGFESANGIIWSKEISDFVAARKLLTTAVTDDASKSGSRCATWTVLNADMSTPQDVIAALRAKQTALAVTLAAEDTQDSFKDQRRSARSPLILLSAMSEGWTRLTPAQQISTALGWIALAALLVGWCAVPAPAQTPLANSHSGPQHAARFLRKRRFLYRALAVVIMVLTFVISVAAAVLAMSEDISLSLFDFTPLHAIMVWLLMDALFLLGWRFWKTIE
jgi:predicted metal-dependent phosphoesterase TrpH